MKNIPDWKEIDSDLYISIFIVTICLSAYYFISNSKNLKTGFIRRAGIEKTKIYRVLLERLSGFLFFGIIPLTVVFVVFNDNVKFYGFSAGNLLHSLYWILVLSPILIIINYFNSKKKENLQIYPQIRTSKWGLQLLIISALTWILYLLAYEFMFRGFLLFVSERNLGFWAAILLNIVVYSLAHIPKGIKETIAAIPFGLVLCIITLQTGNITVACVLHIVLALSNEWFSLKAHPEMRFIKNL